MRPKKIIKKIFVLESNDPSQLGFQFIFKPAEKSFMRLFNFIKLTNWTTTHLLLNIIYQNDPMIF